MRSPRTGEYPVAARPERSILCHIAYGAGPRAKERTSISSEEIKVGGFAVRFIVDGEQTSGSLAVFEFAVPARAKGPARHSHDRYEETVYGIAGVLTCTMEGAAIDVGPGEAVFIPRGAVHRFENSGHADAKALVIVTPGLLGPAYFRELAVVLEGPAGDEPDSGSIADVMRRHGLTLA